MPKLNLSSFTLSLSLLAACHLPIDHPPGSGGDDAGAVPPVTACAAVRCTAGTHCDDTSGTAACVADADAGSTGVCNLQCAKGSHCEAASSGPSCVPDIATSCAATLCPAQTYCDDISGTATCLPLPSCNTVKCTASTHCELTAVQCIRAPCPPLPQCVADTAAVPCGKNTCNGGDYCCNASCGTCAKAGGACTQQACN